ncbi:vanadium-dependent haloperoxidase [Tellurirhabdus bombi]|uniref:vanadium-dependent haloperoxidase n=1 Tax=Tellurirhabdus bombi TaxID=2907205 RepID=UPI001F303F78|nr:vanadium-dependent haloperoxidase [Tellurirhabdus bombi]
MKRVAILLLLLIGGCGKSGEKQPEMDRQEMTKILDQMTDVMVHDVTNPPLAARFFSYALLAGYEITAQHDSTCRSMKGALNDFPVIDKAHYSGYSYQLSSLLAMLAVAKKMQPSGKRLETHEKQLLEKCRQLGFAEEAIESSQHYANQVSKQILGYAKADKYNQISNYPRYTPSEQEGSWYPTPPGFFAPVEPYFNTIRSFTLDSCAQFKPAPPVAFSTDKKSAFYQLLQQNYKAELSTENKQVAAFWDCNPFALEDNGHLMVGMKKISPGAHWLGITSIACEKANLNFAKALKIHTVVAIGLMDGFICCWDEKYRSNRIRPETAIRKYVDASWKPFLQTPPFPEYLSGHSTISATSAVILTHYFGENFQYTDTVEERFGLPARSFKSFHQASDEAGISRFYGGIHFMDAITNGQQQGLKVGQWIIKSIERN